MQYNMRNIFLQKSYTKSGEKLDINPFKKIKKEHISQLTVWSSIQYVFIVCLNWRLLKDIKIKVLATC